MDHVSQVIEELWNSRSHILQNFFYHFF